MSDVVLLAIRSLLFTSFLFVTAMLGAILVLLLFWAGERVHWAITAGWCRLALRAGRFFCGLEVVVEGSENIPDTPSVIMIKHTSALETYWQVTAFPKTTWVVKRELLWIPFFGWALALVLKPIAIDRRAGGKAVLQVIDKGRRRLRSGTWVTIFPEGTRVAPGETRRYGISAAALAFEARVPVVPVAHNAGDFWSRRSFLKRPGTVRFVIGPPIDGGAQGPKETNLLVQNWIEGTMHEISAAYAAKRRQERR